MAAPVAEHAIETATGEFLDLAAPRPEDVTLDAVAAHLSRLCRYAGACRRFYSVAEHAVLVADYLAARGADARTQLCGLHHDDHEAFVGDVARPLKSLLPEYPAIADAVQDAIEQALGLPNPFLLNVHRQVKAADDWALAAEAFHLLPSRGASWFCAGLYDPDSDPVAEHALKAPGNLSDEGARDLYLERHHALTVALERPVRPLLQRVLVETALRFPACRCQLDPAMSDDELVALGGGCTDPRWSCPRLVTVRRRVL